MSANRMPLVIPGRRSPSEAVSQKTCRGDVDHTPRGKGLKWFPMDMFPRRQSVALRNLVVACTFVTCTNVIAQNDSISGKTHDLDEVIVSSHRLERNVLTTKPIQQMQRTELEMLGLQNLADAVKKFAGTSVKDYGGIGGMKTVSVRNLGAHHTAVSYDGVTISNTQAGQIDIGRFTLDNVETLSLAIGDEEEWLLSARHYASAGVLSIITDKGTNNRHFEAKVKGGSFGMVSPSIRWWQPLGERTMLNLNGSFMRADGVYPFVLKNGREKSNEKRYNSDIQSWQGEANLFHTWADSSKLDVKTCWYYSKRGLPGAVVLYNDKSDERLWDEDFFTQAVYSRMLGKAWSMKARLKYAHSWNRYEDTDTKYVNNKQIDVARQNEYYGSVALGWHPVGNLWLSVTEDISYNNLRSNITISDNLTDPPYPTRFTSLTALTARYVWKRLQMNANVVGTFATEEVKAGHKPDDRHRLSPSISLSYRLLPQESLFLRAMYKDTYRMPTFNDLYYLRMGNTGLRPEIAKELNLGITWNGRPIRWMKYLTMTVDGYLNRVTDKIVAFPSTYVWKMANFGKVRITGLDITMGTEIPIVHRVSVVMMGAYTYQKAINKEERSASYNMQLPYTPRHSGNGSVMVRVPWVNIGYSVLAQGKRWSSMQTTQPYALKAYWEHTLTLSREFQLNSCKVTLSGSVNNFTDEQYEIIKYYPMPGRSFTVAGKVCF